MSIAKGQGLGRIAIALGIVGVLCLSLFAAKASAAHSVFCLENVSVCPEKSQYTISNRFTSTVETAGDFAKIELPKLTTISCSSGKIGGPAEPHAEGPLTGYADRFWFSTCTPETCVVNSAGAEEFEFPWELTATGGGDGLVNLSNVTIQVSCSGKAALKFNCKYEAKSLKAELEGGAFNESFLRGAETTFGLKSGTGCPTSTVKFWFRTVGREPQPTYLTN